MTLTDTLGKYLKYLTVKVSSLAPLAHLHKGLGWVAMIVLRECFVGSDDGVYSSYDGNIFFRESVWVSSSIHRLMSAQEYHLNESEYFPIDPSAEFPVYVFE
jgi:hypothetical protein